jgi:Secretion system C-terminal sorting domain
MYVDDITVTRSPLPVELVSFAANVSDNKVKLSWKTASELNNAGFEVQRSADKVNFAMVGFVKGNGTTTESHSYSYVDNVSSGTYYYRLKQNDFSGTFEYSNIVEAKGLPTEFSLSQNYPNPFNPTTTIAFSLPVQSQVHLLLIDVLGNVVKDVADGTYEAGNHKVTLNASDLASGVYFYRLEAGNFVSVKKLMLMK